jgi:ribonuclease BN (tRNA processing enzyme)
MLKILTASVSALLLTMSCVNGDIGKPVNCAQSSGLALQVLGSGGPIADDGRASSGYLVWVDGKSRFLIDTGGGTFLRFGEAGAHFEDLSHIAISHFHTDHSADLVALLKSGYFSQRRNSLSISGPSARGSYPGLKEYLARMLDADKGAYAYLSGYLDGSAGLVKLEAAVVDFQTENPSLVFSQPEDDWEVHAIGVPHGPVPALAYRVRIGRKSIVFSGDQNGSSDAFLQFANNADVLVMHMPVPEGIQGVGRKLHAPPSVIGDIASTSKAGKLVLSHFMARSLDNIEQNLDIIRSKYDGPVINSVDLECITF